jgi:DNA-binding transcriptional MerR regulator
MLDPNNPKDIKSLEKCRNIIKEVIDFGVSQDEIEKLIDLLSLELEDINKMKSIRAILKDEEDTETEIKESLIF